MSATSKTAGEVVALLQELRAQHGVTAIGATGYCWGGFYVTQVAATDKASPSQRPMATKPPSKPPNSDTSTRRSCSGGCHA